MMRAVLVVLALAATPCAARADLKRITIEEIRAAEKSGVPALFTEEDANWMSVNCHIGFLWMSVPEMMEIQGEAKAAGVEPQIIWFRRDDAVIAKCLAGAH